MCWELEPEVYYILSLLLVIKCSEMTMLCLSTVVKV